jgi:hypothetical protein
MDISTYMFMFLSENVLIWLVYALHIGFNVRDLTSVRFSQSLDIKFNIGRPWPKSGEVSPVSFVGFKKPQWTPLTLKFHM